jgi:hypothetical protein
MTARMAAWHTDGLVRYERLKREIAMAKADRYTVGFMADPGCRSDSVTRLKSHPV